MFDNLIARAIVPVTIAVTGFVIFGCLLLYSFVRSDMIESAFSAADNCADTVVKSTRSAMMEDDQNAIQNIVTNIGTRADVKFIKIFDENGKARYSGGAGADSLSATANKNIATFLATENLSGDAAQYDFDHSAESLMVSVPILNEAKCSTAACHFHSEETKVLGFFSIGLSSEHLDKTFSLLRSRMVIFSVMVLFLTIGGVTALLRMNLFLPILRLTYNAEQAASGVAEGDLPKSDHKLGKLNKDFRLLVKQRDAAVNELKLSETADRKVDNGSNE